MTHEEASAIKKGDVVVYRGHHLTVASVTLRGIAAPHFRLDGLAALDPHGGGKVSYLMCSLPHEPRHD